MSYPPEMPDEVERLILAFVAFHPECTAEDIDLALSNGEAKECLERLDNPLTKDEAWKVVEQRNPHLKKTGSEPGRETGDA